MTKKLFVGSLPYAIDDAGLQNLFAQAGAVESARVIMDRASGRSKGFGFVEMATEEEAQKAIAELNGAQVEGRALIVSLARPQTERPERREGGRRGGFDNRRGGDSWR